MFNSLGHSKKSCLVCIDSGCIIGIRTNSMEINILSTFE